jgi:integral membrane sensor domain MASE1
MRTLLNRQDLPLLLGVVASYVLLAKLTALVFAGHGAVSFLWLASGVALAVAVRQGYRVLPAVLLGSLLGNWLLGMPLFLVLLTALRHTAGVGLCLWLIRWEGRFNPDLRALGDCLRVLAVGVTMGFFQPALDGAHPRGHRHHAAAAGLASIAEGMGEAVGRR